MNAEQMNDVLHNLTTEHANPGAGIDYARISGVRPLRAVHRHLPDVCGKW